MSQPNGDDLGIGDLPAGGLVSEGGSAEDSIALAEAEILNAGRELRKEAAKKEHTRHETFRDHVNLGSLVVFWVVLVSLAVGIVVFAFHLLAPPSWHWLSEQTREKLGTILVAAIFSSVLSSYVKKRME